MEGCIVYEDDGNWSYENGSSCLDELRMQLGAIFGVHIIKRLTMATIAWAKAKYSKHQATHGNAFRPTDSDALEKFRGRLDKQAYD